jgi:Na+/proline symporter
MEMSEATARHREHLVNARHSASRDYDKALMTLSAGALGVSITFVHSVAPHPKQVALLGWAWGLFAFSLACVVLSLLLSQYELNAAVSQIDAQPQSAGTALAKQAISTTAVCNWFAGAAFLLGVVMLSWFALINLKAV